MQYVINQLNTLNYLLSVQVKKDNHVTEAK